ncbi:MAG: aromatic acid decarboxylase [Nocardioides sp.]|nr:aromatic acid decarboxylase [Nocardioides sp.]
MGKKSQARRAAKAKDRARQRARAEQHRRDGTGRRAAGPGSDGGMGHGAAFPFGVPGPEPVLNEAEVLESAWYYLSQPDERPTADVGLWTTALTKMPERRADARGEQAVIEWLGTLWEHGWQPVELVRQVRRTGSAADARLVTLAVHAERAGHPGRSEDPRWSAQVAEVGLGDVSVRDGFLRPWRAVEGLDRATSYLDASAVLCRLYDTPPIDVLIPPPGARRDVAVLGLGGGDGDPADPLLRRIRKLLDKAEATEFEQEAVSLTAKAQQLMTRHAIDAAAVAGVDDGSGPRMVRGAVDPPYADHKSSLVAVVARSGRCRAVWFEALGFSTVVGHADDLVGVELLYTSLLVQVQHALRDAARRAPAGTRVRSSSYRMSFYEGFTLRVSERLQAATDAAFDDAGEQGRSALPVLRAREDAIEEFLEQHWGDILGTASQRRGWDRQGWEQGQQAGDRARLDAGELS